MTTNFFSSLSFVAVFGSGIRDPGSGMGKNQDPGSGINIPDPQHWGKLERDFLEKVVVFVLSFNFHSCDYFSRKLAQILQTLVAFRSQKNRRQTDKKI